MTTALATQSELVKIVSHPLRVRCLIAMAERETSASKLAEELDVNVGTLWSHIRKLEQAGVIEEVRQEDVRGATEHFYKAVIRPLTTAEENEEVPPEERTEWAARVVQLITADAAYAIEEGTFAERPDHNAVRFPCHVDEQGWEDLRDLGEEFYERALAIEAQSAGRMVESREPSIPVRVMSMIFEMPS